MTKILCAIDGTDHSKPAIDLAARMAKAFDAELTIMVVNQLLGGYSRGGPPTPAWTEPEVKGTLDGAAAEAQKGPYAAVGGQPGHAEAWEDDDVNRAANDFYRKTRATLEGSYLRPRHDGYMAFQAKASERISDGLMAAENAQTVIADVNRLFRESFL